jgi:hypothetical protein
VIGSPSSISARASAIQSLRQVRYFVSGEKSRRMATEA